MSIRRFFKELCCLCCWPPCFCYNRDKWSRFCFLPPYPSYKFEEIDGVTKFVLTDSRDCALFKTWEDDLQCSYSINDKGNKLAYITHAFCNAKFTIIYSHGNVCDIGKIISECVPLSIKLECDIVLYDYSGYGESSGKPSEKMICSDIEAIWRTMTQEYGVPSSKIILFGKGIGTVPTIDLASRIQVGGVILQSPPISVICSHCAQCGFNCSNNIDKVPNVTSPVLVIHGTADEVIDFSHGVAIYEKCPRPVDPLWVEGAGHNDIESNIQYLERLKRFVTVELVNRQLLWGDYLNPLS